MPIKIEFFGTGSGSSSSSGVTKIVAGTDISISPTGGTGDVTINSTASDTNTNIANTNLTANATTRSYTMASGGNLEIKNISGNNIVDFTSTNLEIGNTNKYTMPNARGSANEFLVQTNGTGTLDFKTLTAELSYLSQTQIGTGQFKGTYSANQILSFNQASADKNSTLGFFCNTTDTTIVSEVLMNSGGVFRQTGDALNGISQSGAKVYIKLSANAGTRWSIHIIRVTIADGSQPTALPISIFTIGQIDFTGSKQQIFECVEFDLEDLGLDIEATCSAYVLGVSSVNEDESMIVNMVANYQNPKGVTLTQS